MPHCQKENYDRQAKSKKERQKKKEEAIARRKAAKARALEEELEQAKLMPNNIALAEGHGEYVLGCEEEKELKARFNVNKRSKKHLRIDIRKQQARKEREDQERLQREQEEQYRLQQEKLKQEAAEQEDEDEDEEPPTEEYLVYICQCCRKKFKTTNQFVNHSNSKKHRDNAELYEEAGVIVTDVQLRKKGHSYNDEEEEYEFEKNEYVGNLEFDQEREGNGEAGNAAAYSDNAELLDDEEDYEPPKKNIFAAFADSDSDNSSESSDEENGDDDEEDNEAPAVSSEQITDDVEYEYDDDLDLLEDIIYQNQLQDRFYPDSDTNKEEKGTEAVLTIPFDNERYNPEHYDINENRLASVQHRLQKRLADKGIEPSQVNLGNRTSDAVSMGKTLLQELMESSIETIQAKLEAYNKHKAECQLLGREFAFAKGNSKALPSQYTFKIDPADNSRRRENVHHAGSHYHMQAARSMQFGRTKGLMARHSSQGSRLQASRMAAKEMANMQGKGAKIGKTSKKSQQKRQGEAGGSKKTGGIGTGDK
mmetsp:Transcript_15576/g.18988  ORF Transcript_15576/g.18988 Transcript_15576/m.18988 type:complete len:537 (-) Transcript_15576:175-1785(-)